MAPALLSLMAVMQMARTLATMVEIVAKSAIFLDQKI
jgi:hypothetical protein